MIIDELPIVMLKCLAMTLVIELLIAALIGIRKKDLLNVMLINIITNPLAVSLLIFFEYNYGLVGRRISLIILELSVFLIEGLFYWKILNNKKINGFLLSIILNGSSYLIGLFLGYII